jgi:hypothetical protein
MPLNEFPGSQIQGINQQGIEINKDWVTVNLDFKSSDTNLYFDPTTYSVDVTYNGAPYTVQKVMTPMSRRDDTIGVWIYEFLTTGFVEGTYVFTFTGSATGIGTVTKTLTFTATAAPVEQYFVGALRTKLWDKRASRYLIDDNTRTRWSSGELFSFSDNARLKVGQAPPSPMNLTWEMAYAEAHDLVLTGGFIEALEAAGIFETWNRVQYSDELTLNIDRSVFYQNAQSLRQQWWNMILAWKRDRAFHALKPVGMGSGKFPLYYSRIMTLSIANFQNSFYG